MHRLGRWRARKHARTRFVATLGCECVMQHAWLCACNATDPGAKLTRNKREPAQRRAQPALVFAPQLFRELRCPHARAPARPHTLTHACVQVRAHTNTHTHSLSLSLSFTPVQIRGRSWRRRRRQWCCKFSKFLFCAHTRVCNSSSSLFKPCSSSVQAHPLCMRHLWLE